MSQNKKKYSSPLWWEIVDCKWLTHTQMCVLIAIARRADANGSNAYPSLTTLMASAKFTRPIVVKVLRELTELGCITVTGMHGQVPVRAINREVLLLAVPPLTETTPKKRNTKPKKAPPIPPASPDTVNEAEETSEFPAQNHMQSTQNGHVRMPGLADFARELRRKNPLLSLPESHKLAQQMRERGEYEPTTT